jgi:hypothetical protein
MLCDQQGKSSFICLGVTYLFRFTSWKNSYIINLSSYYGSEAEFFGRICERNSILVGRRAILAMESVEKLGLSASGEQVVWKFGEPAPQTRAMIFASAIFLTAAIARTKFKLLSKAFDHKAVKITAEVILLLTTACSQIGILPPSVSLEAGPSQTPTVSVNVSKLDTGSRETLEAAGGGDQTATAAAATMQPVMTETPEPTLTRVPDTAIPNVVPTEVPTVAPTETATTEPEPQTCLDISSVDQTTAKTLVQRGYLPYSFNSVPADILSTAGSPEQTTYQEAVNKWLYDWVSSDSRLKAYVEKYGHTPLNWMADGNGPYLMVEGNVLLAGHFSVAAPDGALMTCAIAVVGEKDATGTLMGRTIPLVAGLTSPDGTFSGISIDVGTYPGPALDHQYVVNALTQKNSPKFLRYIFWAI